MIFSMATSLFSEENTIQDKKNIVSIDSVFVNNPVINQYDTADKTQYLDLNKSENSKEKSLLKNIVHKHNVIVAKLIKDNKQFILDLDKNYPTDISNRDYEDEVAQYHFNFNTEQALADNSFDLTTNTVEKATVNVGYWQTVYSIESKQGKLLYRPKNKSRSCAHTDSPCGHHQLTGKALRDIGCKSQQCKKDRLDYAKSLKMSKKLLALNEKRLKKNGFDNLNHYQRYLIHQQGASGIKNILAAVKGDKLLSSRIKKNMANNSPFTYKQLKRMGSKLAATKFMQHWQVKWENEKRLVAGISDYSGIQTVSNDNKGDPLIIPTFSDYEIQLALNYRF